MLLLLHMPAADDITTTTDVAESYVFVEQDPPAEPTVTVVEGYET
jgi:hypothetical protein